MSEGKSAATPQRYIRLELRTGPMSAKSLAIYDSEIGSVRSERCIWSGTYEELAAIVAGSVAAPKAQPEGYPISSEELHRRLKATRDEIHGAPKAGEPPQELEKIVLDEIASSTGPTGGWLDSPKAVAASIVAKLRERVGESVQYRTGQAGSTKEGK